MKNSLPSTKPSERMTPLPKYSAAASHADNDRYMIDFEAALSEITQQAGDRDGGGQAFVNVQSAPGSRVSSAAAATGVSLLQIGGASLASVPGPCGRCLARRWSNGPIDPAGVLLDFSDRNLLCLSLSTSGEGVVGSADHGLYTFDLATGKVRRTLYSKAHGHSDWVACVAHTSSSAGGRIVSGGGDGKLCLWSASGCACHDLEPRHAAPVSVLRCDRTAPLVVSGSYDKTIRIWSVGGSGVGSERGGGACALPKIRRGGGSSAGGGSGARQVACLSGHRAPVMCLTWSDGPNAMLVSGDRDGCLLVHDPSTGQIVSARRHGRGHVTCVAHAPAAAPACESSAGLGGAAEPTKPAGGGRGAHRVLGDQGLDQRRSSSRASDGAESRPSSSTMAAEAAAAWGGGVFLSGGQDGCVRVHDLRQSQAVANLRLHSSPERGTGAVADLAIAAGGGLLVTAGADDRICVVETRSSFARRAVFSEPREFIYSLAVVGDVILSGGGDGRVLAHDLNGTGRGLLWALGASSKGAVRAVGAVGSTVVAASDDGKALVYTLP